MAKRLMELGKGGADPPYLSLGRSGTPRIATTGRSWANLSGWPVKASGWRSTGFPADRGTQERSGPGHETRVCAKSGGSRERMSRLEGSSRSCLAFGFSAITNDGKVS